VPTSVGEECIQLAHGCGRGPAILKGAVQFFIWHDYIEELSLFTRVCSSPTASTAQPLSAHKAIIVNRLRQPNCSPYGTDVQRQLESRSGGTKA
jgi:hypothetical protein